MISSAIIKDLSKKLQTTQLNVRREYVQHLFLSYFYQQKNTNDILFKGGTALRIAFNSPRFSEDLDFSGEKFQIKQIENAIESTLEKIEKEGIKTEIIESKETTGGYLAEISMSLASDIVSLLIQISKRESDDSSEVVVISSDFIAPYPISLLGREHLVREKIQALLTRAKPRDFYDLYFLIRANLISQEQKKLFSQARAKLSSNHINFELELKQFLPKSYWPIIKDFKKSLGQEMSRFV